MKRYIKSYTHETMPNMPYTFNKSTGTHYGELLDISQVQDYKGYTINRLLYGAADYGDSGDEYHTSDEYEMYQVGYERNAPVFETLDAAIQYIDDNL